MDLAKFFNEIFPFDVKYPTYFLLRPFKKIPNIGKSIGDHIFQKAVELVELIIDPPELPLMLMLLEELKVEPIEFP